ncbi:MAG TPA: nuclear transport factor 2 family protein [Burkholderiales bacterium]|nr:nuclear transport factor 2 family protein [Burkholderiales bacterium]
MISASVPFGALLERMTQAICRGDGAAAAACFTADGTYHDGFYGEFRGREAIREMIEQRFHRDAREFVWNLADVVSDGRVGYAHYDFSYVSKLPGAEGRRVGFAGISRCRLRNGLIERYDEAFDRGPVLVQLGFAPERIARSLARKPGTH